MTLQLLVYLQGALNRRFGTREEDERHSIASG